MSTNRKAATAVRPPPGARADRAAARTRAAALAASALGVGFAACAFALPAWLQGPLLAAAWWRLAAARGARGALAQGWLFGLGWFGASLWWLYISLHDVGGMPAPLAVFGVAALVAYLALFPAAAAALGWRLRAGGPWPWAGAWCLAEWARGELLTGFPWAAGGYAQIDAALAGYAKLGGIDAVNLAVALGAAALASLLRFVLATRWFEPNRAEAPANHGPGGSKIIAASAAVALLLLLPLGGALLRAHDFTQPAGRLRVALVQPAIAQEEKFASRRLAANLEQVRRQVEQAAAAAGGTPLVVVAPETAVPLLPGQLPEGWLAAFAEPALARGAALMTGIPLARDDTASAAAAYTNSVLGWAPGAGPPYRYDKAHLVPFGEFIPPGFRWFVDAMRMPLGDFARGHLRQPSFAYGGQRLAPTICYEDVFGEELRPRFADAAGAPTLFVNLTNLAWFGDTIALGQHLAIARMRSVEFGRASVRATNTGATAAIDHHGRVLAALPHWRSGVLEAEVEGRTGLTPYARGGRLPVLLAALALLAGGLAAGGLLRRRP